MPAKPNTPEQFQQAIDLIEQYGNTSAASRASGVPVMTLRARWEKAKAQGFLPTYRNATREGHPAIDPYMIKGTSTLVKADGSTAIQWIKTQVDPVRWKQLTEAACRAACRQVKPHKRVKRPTDTLDDLLTLYTITDYHMGMLAWGRETGAPWDLTIAKRVLMDVLGAMVDASPRSAVGVLNQLGDFLHFDSLKALTPEHGHLLDADSRYQKVVEVTVEALIWCVHRMLEKHERVHVFMHEGNHDPAGSIWLRVLFAQVFQNNPRVTVEKSPRPYVIYEWGKTLLGFHHGHLSKKEKLPALFAALFREAWGRVTHMYIHTGHQHHVDEKEYPGCNVQQHPTMAAPDAYAARGGWLSKRQAASIDYHKTRGEIARRIHLPSE